jgi:hypothetical protein
MNLKGWKHHKIKRTQKVFYNMHLKHHSKCVFLSGPAACNSIDCDSSMLSMKNITWGWRGVQQKGWSQGGRGVVVDSDWLVWFGQVIEGVMLKSDHMMRVCSYNVRGFHREHGNPTGFSLFGGHWT